MRIPSRRRDRAGFSLIEMLFAVGVILVLILLSAAAIVKFRQTGPYLATTTNLDKLKKLLDTQWQAVLDKAKRDPIDVTPAALGVASLAHPEARANFTSARIAQAFPISFVEVFGPGGACGPWQPYRTYLSSIGVTAANAASFEPDVQQGVCLLMILEKGPQSTGSGARDVLGTSIANVIDINPKRLPAPFPSGQTFACVDGWNRPVFFSREFWKTKNPTPGVVDRDKTLGLVSCGPDGKHGMEMIGPTRTLDMGNAGFHTLKPMTADAQDNVVNPDLP